MNMFSISNKKLILLFFIVIGITLFLFAIPETASAQLKDVPDQLVTCGGQGQAECNYCDLFNLAQNIINFLVFFSVILATLIIVYVGFLYLTAGDNPGQITKAKGILVKVLIGFLIVLSSWLIVDIVMKSFFEGGSRDDPGTSTDFGPWNPVCDSSKL